MTFTRWYWQIELDERLRPTGRDIVAGRAAPAALEREEGLLHRHLDVRAWRSGAFRRSPANRTASRYVPSVSKLAAS